VSETKGQAYGELYWKLDMKEDKNDVYKMTKHETSIMLNVLRMRLMNFW
jgi:hypothetical protein